MTVTVVVDNEAAESGLIAEHGLSLWIEADGMRVLFDTGQGKALLPNAHRLGIAPGGAHAVALSHGHYDHAGGLAFMTDGLEPKRLYLHPGALRSRFSRRGPGTVASIGMPEESKAVVRRIAERVVWTEEAVQLTDSIGLTGRIPRTADFDSTGGRFFLDEGCRIPDPIDDDQALWVKTGAGVVVILGCAHAGVVNTLDHVSGLLGVDRFHAVVGGLHLADAPEERLMRTAESLDRYRVERLVVGHCTGRDAAAALKARCSAEVIPLQSGTRMEF